MTDAELAKALRAAQRAVQRASERTEAETAKRDALVWAAHDQGWLYPEIAAELEISVQRVAQIVQRNPEFRPRGRRDRH